MWDKIKQALGAVNKFLKGKKRRIAAISGAITSVGALTGIVPLVIIGTIGTALFSSLDAKENPGAYKNLLKK